MSKPDDHELVPAEKVQYPGGKDGMWRASCVCGKHSAYSGTAEEAERSISQHVERKKVTWTSHVAPRRWVL